MKNENFYNLHSEFCKIISNPRRQAIINALREKPMTVKEIAEETEISQSNISQNLSLLRLRNIVDFSRSGNNVYYRLANLKIIKAYDIISEVLQESLDLNIQKSEEAIIENN